MLEALHSEQHTSSGYLRIHFPRVITSNNKINRTAGLKRLSHLESKVTPAPLWILKQDSLARLSITYDSYFRYFYEKDMSFQICFENAIVELCM